MRSKETMWNDATRADHFEHALTAALKRQPAIAVPPHFAARVMSQLSERRSGRPKFSFSRRVAYASVAVVTLALLVLASVNQGANEAGKSFAFAVDMLLVLELLGVGLWLGLRQDG